ncbi:triosephosphate isomerase [Conyzicola lurida]|uniref:Triosephosphate isomerase n=1 Tax=Conyzicola lurida TaxID=1172621 RepID=A0A841AI54_9MICO|nr:triosephosphate isomerase [Conyzicola lurida]
MTTYIGVSTKAYLGWRQSLDWIDRVRDQLVARPLGDDVRLFVIPSYPVIPAAIERLGPLGVLVGAQNVSTAAGALTGEVSAELLGELGVDLVEVGHAERRSLFDETDEIVRQKTAAISGAGMTPLLCIGESTLGEPDAAAATCLDQVIAATGGDASLAARLVLAYEPVWAIGAAQPAPPAYIAAVVVALRHSLEGRFGAPSVPVVYGGSAGPGLLSRLPEVDGLFLGRFAHDPANLALVLEEARSR